MRKARGHFSLDGLLTDLFLLFGIPALSIISLLVLAFLKIWCKYSWWWLLVPVGVFIVWLVTIEISSRR